MGEVVESFDRLVARCGYLKAQGVRHPERFRAELPEGAEQMMGGMPGAPGVPNDTIQFPGNQGAQGGQPFQPPEKQAFGA